MEKLSMIMTITGGEACGSPEPEPADDVYQEAALNLRYKRITAITAGKLERAMVLLQLKPCHLVDRGLANRSSLAQGLDCSVQKGSSETEERRDNSQDDQDDGWHGYEDNYDSESEIDDDEDQDGEVEGRRKGPMYAFLVYGGVQLRPDEYILLFRALGVSPQYIEQLQRQTASPT